MSSSEATLQLLGLLADRIDTVKVAIDASEQRTAYLKGEMNALNLAREAIERSVLKDCAACGKTTATPSKKHSSPARHADPGRTSSPISLSKSPSKPTTTGKTPEKEIVSHRQKVLLKKAQRRVSTSSDDSDEGSTSSGATPPLRPLQPAESKTDEEIAQQTEEMTLHLLSVLNKLKVATGTEDAPTPTGDPERDDSDYEQEEIDAVRNLR